jgi:uracil-DNA glycosylase
MTQAHETLESLLDRVRSCTICQAHLPLGPRPVVRVSATAKLLIIGQAPGTKVHASGIPWDDPSGDRLRDWLGLSPEIFYDTAQIAIMPTGFCYPGGDPKGGMCPGMAWATA